MTVEAQNVPPQTASPRRRLAGLGVGVGLLAVLFVPVGFAAFAAMASFTGCFVECSDPEPLVGAMWVGIALFMLIVPLVAGLATAGVLKGWGWRIVLVTAALVTGLLFGPWILSQAGRWVFS